MPSLQMRKTLSLLLVTVMLLTMLPSFAQASSSRPAFNVLGADTTELNGLYTEGVDYNGKAFYWGPGGGPCVYWVGSRWELMTQVGRSASYYSNSTSNGILPPTDGWVKANGSVDSNFSLSYGADISFVQTAVTVNETAESVTLNLMLNASNLNFTTVNYRTTDGTAKAGEDYALTDSTASIGSGYTTTSFSIEIINDETYEGAETFTVSLYNASSGTAIKNGTATVTINSDDSVPTVSLSTATSNVSEDASNAVLTATLSNPSSAAVTVNYATGDLTAKSGSDYTAKSGTLTIPAGDNSATVNVPIILDNINESDEGFQFTLTSPSGATLGAISSSTVTIKNVYVPPTVEFASATKSVGEVDGSVVLPVSLSFACAYDVTVQYATANGSSVSGLDYTLVAGTLTIPAGSTSASISVPILNDTIYEGNESFTVSLSSPTESTLGTKVTSTVTITDDEIAPTVEFVSSPSSIDENDGSVDLSVSLSHASASNVTVSYVTADYNTVAGDDYTAKNATLTIPAGNTAAIITIPILDDTIYEGSESFLVSLYDAAGATFGARKNSVVTINDNEIIPTVEFASSLANVGEEDGNVIISVSLSHPSVYDVTIGYQTADGTAVAGKEYTFKTGTLTILAGSISGTVTIPILNDSIFEGDESFEVILSNPTGATLGTKTVSTVTVIDDEVAPTVEFASAVSSVNENGSSVVLGVTLSYTSINDVTVSYTTADGTAKTGIDYTAVSGTLTIPAGQTSQGITIPILNDGIYEGNESFIVTLSSPTESTLGTKVTSTVTIGDDEVAPKVSFVSSSSSIGESGGSVDVSVSLSHPSSTSVTVKYVTANESGVAGSDYTAKNATLTIPAGNTSATITVPILDDMIYEGNESFAITLSNPTGATLGSTTINTVGINDDDVIPTLQFIASDTSIGEEDGNATLIVSLSHASAFDISVGYQTADGTAVAGEDYSAKTGTLMIPAGNTSVTVTIPILDDSIYEGDESFTVTLSSPTGATMGTKDVSTVTISDDETLPTIEFASSTTSQGEEDGIVHLPITLSYPSAFDVTVEYETLDDTAVGDSDYTTSSGTYTISAGDTTGSISIPIHTDTIYEKDETFTVGLSRPVGATVGTNAVSTVTINDDEAEPTVEFASTTASIGEENISIDLSVTLSYPSAFDVTVVYETQDDSALGGSDYTISSGTHTILAGDTAANITIPILDDTIYEGDESFTVTLSSPTGATMGAKDASTVTIINYDTVPAVEFAASTYSVNEETGSIDLAVTLSHPSAFDLSVLYATADATAMAGDDYTEKTVTLTVPKGEVTGYFTIPILNDAIYEGDETFTVTLSAPTGGLLGTTTATSVTIVDDEIAPTVEFASPTASINEGDGSIDLAVALSYPSAFDVTVEYETMDVTAVGESDYTTLAATCTISAGDTSGTISIPILDDTIYEGEETFTVALSSPTGATIGTKAISIVSVIDDEVMPTVEFASTTASINEENGSIDLSVTLTHPSAFDVTVQYATEDDSAIGGSDYTTSTGTHTIPAGDTTASLSIPILPDTIYEREEEFKVNLSSPSGATLGTKNMSKVKVIDDEVEPTVGFASTTSSGDEGDGSIDLSVTLSHPSAFDVTLEYDTEESSAIAESDYTSTSDMLTIPAGDTASTISVPILEDSIYEGDESFALKLSSPSGATLCDDTNTITIVDNEIAPTVELVASSSTVSETDTGSTLAILLSHPSAFDITVEYATDSGTASGGADYTTVSDTLTIPAGDTTGEIIIPILDDIIYEGEESFTVTLSSPVGATLGTKDTNTVTIQSEENMPTIQLYDLIATANEDDGTTSFEITLSHPSAFDITVEYDTADGTAIALDDYTTISGVMTISAGDTAGTLEIRILSDNIYEKDEDFTLALCDPIGATLGSIMTSTVTILDSDVAPTMEVTAASATTGEYDGTVTISISLSHPSAFEVTVDYDTADDTAQGGLDYTTTTGTRAIPAGDVTASISVPILQDTIHEGEETFTVTLSDPEGATLGAGVTTTIAIQDDETPPTIEFETSTATVNEDDGEITLDIALSHASAFDTTVNYLTVDDSAIGGLDFTTNAVTITIPAGELGTSVTIEIEDDIFYEVHEAFTVKLSGPVGVVLGSKATSTVTIESEDEMPTIQFVEKEYGGVENEGDITLTVALSHPSAFDVTVACGTVEDTATSDVDFAPISETLTILAGETTLNKTITILDDNIYEESEKFSVALTAPSGATLGLRDIAAIAIEDDELIPTVQFAIATASVDEVDGTLELNLLLSHPSAFDITFDFKTVDGSAKAENDYIKISGTKEIPAGEISSVLPITLINDDVYEGDETFAVYLKNPTGATLGTIDLATCTIKTEDFFTIAGLPAMDTVRIGEQLLYSPTPSGGTWEWDETYFTADFIEGAVFTPIMTGMTELTYSVNGISHTTTILIQDSTFLYEVFHSQTAFRSMIWPLLCTIAAYFLWF